MIHAVPLYQQPVYTDHEVNAYFDGFGGDAREVRGSNRQPHYHPLASAASFQSPVRSATTLSHDSRSVSHIEHATPVRSLRSAAGRTAFSPASAAAAAGGPPVIADALVCFGESTDVLARRMLLRQEAATLPVVPHPVGGGVRAKAMVRGVTAAEASEVVEAQRLQMASMARAAADRAEETAALLQQRQEELLAQRGVLQELHERRAAAEADRQAVADELAGLSGRVAAREARWAAEEEGLLADRAAAAAAHRAAVSTAVQEKEVVEGRLMHAGLHVSELQRELRAARAAAEAREVLGEVGVEEGGGGGGARGVSPVRLRRGSDAVSASSDVASVRKGVEVEVEEEMFEMEGGEAASAYGCASVRSWSAEDGVGGGSRWSELALQEDALKTARAQIRRKLARAR